MSDTGSVTWQLNEIMEEVSKNVEGVLKTQSLAVAKECVQKLRNTSPKKTGDYARGWKVSTQGKDYVVHNATDYQLTHLLENSHVIRNKKGTYGRSTPHKHIKPVEEWAIDELPQRIEREL